MMRDLDPEDARAIVDPALRITVDAVRCYKGYVVQPTGDGIFALFGAPARHEDHPHLGWHRPPIERIASERGWDPSSSASLASAQHFYISILCR